MNRLTVILISLLLFAFSCEKFMSDPDNMSGILKLSFNSKDMVLKKTIEPGVDVEIQKYDITGNGPNDDSFELLGQEKLSEFQVSLKPGQWTISVDAKNSNDVVIGKGEIDVEIQAGGVTNATILISPLEGSGTLDIEISWPSDILTAPAVEASLMSSDSTTTSLEFILASDGLSASYHGEVTAGYYTFSIKLLDGTQQVWGKTDAARILAGHTTSQTYPLIEEVNQGGLILTVNESMQEPITVSLSGISEQITGGESMQVSASTSEPVDSYQWYLNGDYFQQEVNPSITIGETLDVGSYALDVIVKRNQILSSQGFSFTVLEPDTMPLHLYLLIGQSNMAGRGEISEIDTTTHPRVFMLTKDEEWVQAKEPVQFDKEIVGVGPGLAFGKRMANFSYKKYKRIGLIPAAIGGTSIEEWQKGTWIYARALNYANVAMEDGQLQGILWHQGEADSDSGLAEEYEDKLIQFIGDIRGDLNNESLPFLVGGLADSFIQRNSYAEIVDQSLRDVADIVGDVSYVSAEGLIQQADSSHFDSESYRELGSRYAVEMSEYEQNLK